MADLTGLVTGLSQGLTAYLGDSIKEQRDVRKADYQNQLDMQKATYQSNLDLNKTKASDKYKQELESVLTPEMADRALPGLGSLVAKHNEERQAQGLPPLSMTEGTGYLKTALDALKEAKTPSKLTGAEGVVDREFAKEYAKYVAGGGYADTINQIQTLEGVIGDLEGGKKNLTGPVIGTGDISGVTGLPRKILAGKSVAAQQAVEQSIQRSLKQTLGGQFTEREGTLFMQRGYDPQLSEKENSKKLRRAVGQLKSMALAKQKAVDYYEEHGTLTGFKGEFFTLKEGVIQKASKDDFYKMMGESPNKAIGNSSDPLGLGI